MKIGNNKATRKASKTIQNKGISPILASLLLIVIAVAASIVAYAWIQGNTTAQLNQASGFLLMENVRFYDNDKIELFIRNTGTADIHVDTIYVDDVGQTVTQQILGKDCVSIVLDHNWDLGTKYSIKVATTSGLFAEKTCTTPSSYKMELEEGWTKRKQVTIDNTLNPESLTNYQVRIDVQYESDMNSDFSDLRFTTSDEHTLIPYWIENFVASDSAVVWVKTSSISALSTETIFMYYGNPFVNSKSDPHATFSVFLDFTAEGIETYGGSNQDQDPTQVEIIDDTILHMWGNNWKAVMETLDVVGDGSQAICFDFNSDGTQGEINGIGLDTDSSISQSQTYRIYGTQNWGNDDHYGHTLGDWQSYSIILDDFSGSFDRIVILNDADASQATNVYYRNVRVAKTSSVEPMIIVNSEETL